MNLSQKCQYALRAVYELAKRNGDGPVTISEIAEAQAIPSRFLGLILGELKHGGFVESRRGVKGGYLLAGSPSSLSVGAIIRFVEGPVAPVVCVGGEQAPDCRLFGNCAFISMWERARDAMAGIYESTSFQDLMDEQRTREGYVPTYNI